MNEAERELALYRFLADLNHQLQQARDAERALRVALRMAREFGASDLFLTPGEPPNIRLHGRVKELKAKPLRADECRDMVCSMLTEEQLRLIEGGELHPEIERLKARVVS